MLNSVGRENLSVGIRGPRFVYHGILDVPARPPCVIQDHIVSAQGYGSAGRLRRINSVNIYIYIYRSSYIGER